MSPNAGPPSVGDTVTRIVTPPLDRTREAVPVLADAPPDAEADLKLLLARRLRQASLMLAAIYAAFLLVHFLLTPRSFASPVLQGVTLAVALGVQSGIAGLTCLRRGYRWWTPWAEWASLGVFWVALGLIMYSSLTDPRTADLLGRYDLIGQSILANTWMLPWFAVMAGYPAMVPNTVRRTVWIVAITAAAPLLVAAVATATRPELAQTGTLAMFPQFVVWGLIGGSISVYGAMQASLLRKEAFAAKKFGQYRLVRKLGAGGMGEVHLAEHQLLRRPSVIKLVRADRRGDVKTAKRFEREVKMLASLNHWNTVEIYDYGHTADGTFYFVMEYLPGVNLDEFVRKYGPLSPARAVFLVRQVCAALREAHAIGLVHRDIKPANVMACEWGKLHDVAKLLDFGLGRDEAEEEDDKLTRDGVILGTPAFLSPEQACGKPTDARSDVYSLGATLFYLLAGTPVFDKKGAVAMAAAHIHEPPTAPPGAPDDLSAVVLKCLAKDPAARFQSVRELDRALAACACAADWDHDTAEAWWLANGG